LRCSSQVLCSVPPIGLRAVDHDGAGRWGDAAVLGVGGPAGGAGRGRRRRRDRLGGDRRGRSRRGAGGDARRGRGRRRTPPRRGGRGPGCARSSRPGGARRSRGVRSSGPGRHRNRWPARALPGRRRGGHRRGRGGAAGGPARCRHRPGKGPRRPGRAAAGAATDAARRHPCGSGEPFQNRPYTQRRQPRPEMSGEITPNGRRQRPSGRAGEADDLETGTIIRRDAGAPGTARSSSPPGRSATVTGTTWRDRAYWNLLDGPAPAGSATTMSLPSLRWGRRVPGRPPPTGSTAPRPPLAGSAPDGPAGGGRSLRIATPPATATGPGPPGRHRSISWSPPRDPPRRRAPRSAR
jgi:hypothetical protein